MQKIYNYITAGQGLGVKFLLVLSLVMAIIFGLSVKINGKDLIPYAQNIANEMLPIKIVNGVVVEPYDTIKVFPLDFGTGSTYPMVIDTTKTSLNTDQLGEGIYLTRTALYTIKSSETRIFKLADNLDLPKADYTDAFKSILNWAALFAGIFGAVFSFIGYFLLSIFYAACSYAVSALQSKKYNFDQRMRLGVISLITVYIVFIPLNWIVTTNALIFFIAVILLEALIIKELPIQAKEEKAETETPVEVKTAVIKEAKTKEAAKPTKKAATAKTPAKAKKTVVKKTTSASVKKTAEKKAAPAKKEAASAKPKSPVVKKAAVKKTAAEKK